MNFFIICVCVSLLARLYEIKKNEKIFSEYVFSWLFFFIYFFFLHLNTTLKSTQKTLFFSLSLTLTHSLKIYNKTINNNKQLFFNIKATKKEEKKNILLLDGRCNNINLYIYIYIYMSWIVVSLSFFFSSLLSLSVEKIGIKTK